MSLLLAAIAPAAWPLGPAWALAIIALVIADAQLARFNDKVKVETNAPRMVGVGAGDVNVSFYVTFESAPAPTAEMSIDTNTFFSPFPARRTVDLADGYGQTAFRLTPHRRGAGMIEDAYIRWQGPLGLAWCQRVTALNSPIAITPDFDAVEREAAKLFSRTQVHGLKPLKDRGDGSEFDALAKFESGMDRRLVDWKQSARHLNLLAKEVRIERNHQLAFAIDTGRLMCEPVGGAPKVDHALNAALSLAYVGLKLGDRVSMFGFDAAPNLSTGFVTGSRAFGHLKAITSDIDYSSNETNHTLGLATLAERLQRRSMVVVFTDFADTISAELMIENLTRLARKHLIIFVTFRDEELEQLREGDLRSPSDVTRAVIANQLLRERNIVLTRLKRLGIHILDAPAGNLGPSLIAAYDELRRKERL